MKQMMNTAKYDSSLELSYNFYDQLPYKRNMSVCGNDCIRMYSGNVIKQYACKEIERREVPNQDDMIEELLRNQMQLTQQEETFSETE